MSKELYFTDGNNEVKYLDTTASFNLAITQDGSAFDLTNATAIDVKVANDTGYVFDKSIDMTTITQPLAGLITMPVDAEVMNALVPDDYTIEVWVTLSSLVTPGSQEGLTDTSTDSSATATTTTTDTTTTTTDTTTYNAIFPSDDPQGFTITENVMSDSGDVIPVMSLDAFQQEFDQLKTDLTNQVSTLQGPAGKDGENGKDGATGPQGPQGIQGPKGDTGQGLEIKGKVDTTSQLPATASEGDGYLVAEELYIWTDNAWKDCGQIQGPAGKDGKDGATGPQGPQGPAGKDGTQVDLSNYATQQQLATKADTTATEKNVSDMNVEVSGGFFFNTDLNTLNSPFSGGAYYYKVLMGVWSRIRQVAYSDLNGSQMSTRVSPDGGATWTDWVSLATTDDVTTAISTATANMVDSSKPTNFTNGLQSGGVDVATAADLKSIEDSAWHQLDNKYITLDKTTDTLTGATVIYRTDESSKRLYYTLLANGGFTSYLRINFSGVVKNITTPTDPKYNSTILGNGGRTLAISISFNKISIDTGSGALLIVSAGSQYRDSTGAWVYFPCFVNYDELV